MLPRLTFVGGCARQGGVPRVGLLRVTSEDGEAPVSGGPGLDYQVLVELLLRYFEGTVVYYGHLRLYARRGC